MKKKYVFAGITGIFLLISGVFYSCTYQENSTPALLVTDRNDTAESTKDELSDTNAIIREENTLVGNEQTQLTAEETRKENTKTEVITKPEKLSVHVCGAVTRPGVYETEEDARVCDLIELAGGLSKDAAGDYVNQAQKVADGQRIYIPTKEEVEDVSLLDYAQLEQQVAQAQQVKQDEAASGVTSGVTLININSAPAEELMKLPGVGEAKAAAIIEYRSANGSFQSIQDLMKISGIKEGLFHKIEKYITVE